MIGMSKAVATFKKTKKPAFLLKFGRFDIVTSA
jgi:hypothetical protein